MPPDHAHRRSVCATTAAADVINCKWLKLAPPLEPISHSERQTPLQNKRAKDTAASEIHDGIRQHPVQCCAAACECHKNKAESEAATRQRPDCDNRNVLDIGHLVLQGVTVAANEWEL